MSVNIRPSLNSELVSGFNIAPIVANFLRIGIDLSFCWDQVQDLKVRGHGSFPQRLHQDAGQSRHPVERHPPGAGHSGVHEDSGR